MPVPLLVAMPPAGASTAAVAAPRLGAGNRYSVLLPTYNERENLPIMIDLLVQTFTQKSEHAHAQQVTAISARTGRMLLAR